MILNGPKPEALTPIIPPNLAFRCSSDFAQAWQVVPSYARSENIWTCFRFFFFCRSFFLLGLHGRVEKAQGLDHLARAWAGNKGRGPHQTQGLHL